MKIRNICFLSWFVLFLSFLFTRSFSQTTATPDTAFINELNDKSYNLRKTNPDSCALLAQQAIQLSEKINFLKGLGDGYIRLGLVERTKGNYREALKLYKQSLVYRKQIGNIDLVGRVYSNIGNAFSNLSNFDSAIYYHLLSLRIAEQINKLQQVCDYTNNLADAYRKSSDLKNAEVYFLRSLEIARQMNDTSKVARGYVNLGSVYYEYGNYRKGISYSKTGVVLAEPLNDKGNLAPGFGNLAICYQDLNKPDSALYYFDKAAVLYSEMDEKRDLAIILSNTGILHFKLHDFPRSVDYLKQSLIMSDSIGDKNLSITNYEYLGQVYNAMGDPTTAYQYMLKIPLLKDSVYNSDKAEAISDMQTKYETEKKEKEIVILNGQNKVRLLQRNIFMASAIALLAIAAGLFLFFRQKQQIAVKNDRIQKQQIGELLNTQEIKSLNSMMEGQEKERKRIAEDLHDRVGSSLAAIKLHMNSVARIFNISEDSNEQFFRVNSMFDEVVKEVRQVSHDLASGVLMKFGLVPALRDLCESIESAGHQKVSLITHGMDERLDNQTEIIVYRVVQECIGNILKHAQASEIHIQLTRHEHSFMLMIEDDGVGFDPQKVKSDGMGLKNISTRVQQLEGTVHFDSSPGKGTTTTVEIPFNHTKS